MILQEFKLDSQFNTLNRMYMEYDGENDEDVKRLNIKLETIEIEVDASFKEYFLHEIYNEQIVSIKNAANDAINKLDIDGFDENYLILNRNNDRDYIFNRRLSAKIILANNIIFQRNRRKPKYYVMFNSKYAGVIPYLKDMKHICSDLIDEHEVYVFDNNNIETNNGDYMLWDGLYLFSYKGLYSIKQLGNYYNNFLKITIHP